MKTKAEICRNWLPRYTGSKIEDFADHILLTNFQAYVNRFAEMTDSKIVGLDRAMPNATCRKSNVTMINFGMGSANAATIMDLLSAKVPKAVLFLGKCGGLKHSTEIGHFILPIAAIRGEGTSNDYFPPEVPAMPSFKLHKFVSQKIVEAGHDYRTGVVYTTNRRVWEHDQAFLKYMHKMKCIAVDMETATILMVGLYNEIARGALLVVSDVPITPEGVKTEMGDKSVSAKWTDIHIQLGIESLKDLEANGEPIKHFKY
ncbi:AMP nucleosidase [Spirobacillus cienkowskii]|jgi:AMP nucleosidase|uniref:AMP nucleosidase n=1 Tax=Spirobacillus cienkowskii TaxID=495820 RepID=A0A369KRC6_9BACT|nr:MAG: AMP nucleosidase [Spirobacillus cienkowskii]